MQRLVAVVKAIAMSGKPSGGEGEEEESDDDDERQYEIEL